MNIAKHRNSATVILRSLSRALELAFEIIRNNGGFRTGAITEVIVRDATVCLSAGCSVVDIELARMTIRNKRVLVVVMQKIIRRFQLCISGEKVAVSRRAVVVIVNLTANVWCRYRRNLLVRIVVCVGLGYTGIALGLVLCLSVTGILRVILSNSGNLISLL